MQGSRVVLELTQHLWNSGRTEVTDNFFSSLELVNCLESRHLTFLGTIRSNKPELPPDFQPHKSRAVGSSSFGFNSSITIVSYVPKRNKVVNLISSYHTGEKLCPISNKPQIILDYNVSKGGVDTLDQLVRSYSSKRRTRRWPMSLFFNLLDIDAYNSMVLYIQLNPTWNSLKLYRRRLYLIMLAYELAGICEDHGMSRLWQHAASAF